MFRIKHTFEQAANPDLGNAGAGATAARVAPLGEGVRREVPMQGPMGNDAQDTSRYFYCTVPTASMHRQDGKRLPFLNGLLKTNIKQDIDFLDKEIDDGNIYIRRATQDEIANAKIIEDPMGSVREAVRAELTNSFSVEDLEKLLAERRAAVSSGGLNRPTPGSDAAKIAGVDVNKAASAAIQAQGVSTHPGGATTASLSGLIKASNAK